MRRPTSVRSSSIASLLVVLALIAGGAGCAGASADADGVSAPPDVVNCGTQVVVEAPPERAVTMNQAATEVLLSLGLADRMAGTAYRDDALLPELADDYEQVPVLADEYPSTEALLAVEPDFVYASYASAFREGAAGERDGLAGLGIASYLSPAACPEERGGGPLTIDDVFAEIVDIGAVFGASDRAEALVTDQRDVIARAAESLADDEPISVFWWDGDTDAPFTGACCGGPGMILAALGLENAFGDIDGAWGNVSWEQVIERDPEVIVLVDAEWDPAIDKLTFLEGDAALSGLTAVREGRTVTLPFSSTTPGVRNAAAVEDLAGAIRALDLRP